MFPAVLKNSSQIEMWECVHLHKGQPVAITSTRWIILSLDSWVFSANHLTWRYWHYQQCWFRLLSLKRKNIPWNSKFECLDWEIFAYWIPQYSLKLSMNSKLRSLQVRWITIQNYNSACSVYDFSKSILVVTSESFEVNQGSQNGVDCSRKFWTWPCESSGEGWSWIGHHKFDVTRVWPPWRIFSELFPM